MLGPIEQSLVIFAMFVLMVGMGSTLSTSDIGKVFKSPRSLVLGLIVQILVFPWIALQITQFFEISPLYSLAFLMIGCTPGGTSSNMYTWFARGNLSLSLAMTSCSNILSLFTMPLILALLIDVSNIELSVPIEKILLSLSFVIIPVAIGIFLRKQPNVNVEKVQKIGALAGVIATVGMLVLWLPKMYAEYMERSTTLYLAIFTLGLSGFILGYLITRFAGEKSCEARTISLEVGLQNTLLTFTIMSLSLEASLFETIGWIPLVYGAGIMGLGGVMVALFLAKDKMDKIYHSSEVSEGRLSDWQLFVLRHQKPLNLWIHLGSCLLFWGGIGSAFLFDEWLFLSFTAISGIVGTLGHIVSNDNGVSGKEAVYSLDAIRFSTKLSFLFVLGSYQKELSEAKSLFKSS